MKTRTKLAKPTNYDVPHQRDGKTLQRCAAILVCSLILMVGFFAAARQHFYALDWSQKNVKLRQAREQLKNERQRLLIERENALSNQTLGKKAEKIGLQMIRSSQLDKLADVVGNKIGELQDETKKTLR